MRPDRRTDGRTDRRTDRRTDGHGDSSIPPPNFVAGGITNLCKGHLHRDSDYSWSVPNNFYTKRVVFFALRRENNCFEVFDITKAGDWWKSVDLGAHAREMIGGGRWGEKARVSRLSRDYFYQHKKSGRAAAIFFPSHDKNVSSGGILSARQCLRTRIFFYMA